MRGLWDRVHLSVDCKPIANLKRKGGYHEKA